MQPDRSTHWKQACKTGGAEGAIAAIVALVASAALSWVVQGPLALVAAGSEWLYLLYYGVGSVVFGLVLAARFHERAIASASAAAGLCLLFGILGVPSIEAGLFAFLVLPLAVLVSTVGATGSLLSLVVLSGTDRRRELAAWTLGGWSVSLIVTPVYATVAPNLFVAIDPVVPHAAELADLGPASLLWLLGFYPVYAPATFPIAAAGYGAGLVAVRGPASDRY